MDPAWSEGNPAARQRRVPQADDKAQVPDQSLLPFEWQGGLDCPERVPFSCWKELSTKTAFAKDAAHKVPYGKFLHSGKVEIVGETETNSKVGWMVGAAVKLATASSTALSALQNRTFPSNTFTSYGFLVGKHCSFVPSLSQQCCNTASSTRHNLQSRANAPVVPP